MKNMKMNKWTMGLAAAGIVSLSSVAQAQDAAAGAEALAASTSLTGYVSTGYKFNNGAANTGYFGAGGRNAFSMDVVDLKLSSAQGDGAQASGYTVELWFGGADIGTGNSIGGGTWTDTNADGLVDAGEVSNVSPDSVQLMNANIDLRLNDIDLKIGQFGTIVGNEVYNYNENAHYTHSWGFAIEPTHHTGLLASYTVSDDLQISAGIANSSSANISATGANAENKTVLASVSYTLPSSAGALAGTELYYGYIAGVDSNTAGEENTDYHYSSIALPEFIANLSTKVTWDHVEHAKGTGIASRNSDVVGLYLGYQLNDTTTLNIRGEMGNLNTSVADVATGGVGTPSTLGTGNADNLQSFTVGVNHKIWENVISRIEYRHDEVDNTTGDTSDNQQDVIALNIIYSF
jgi:hypothetical protein